jgi:hypothetical protein
MPEPERIVFNVGGVKYEVSRSLLDMYPDTMLARSASKEWTAGKTGEIFLERNGARFQFVLDYLRDGKVSLPLTASKAAVLADLVYYGVENVDEDTIDETLTNAAHAARGINHIYEALSDLGYRTTKVEATRERQHYSKRDYPPLSAISRAELFPSNNR